MPGSGRHSGIQKSYIDALGKRHAAGRETVRAIEHAMAGRARAGQGAGRGNDDGDTLVVEPAASCRSAGVEIQLEDGTTLAIDGRLPARSAARLSPAAPPPRSARDG